MSLIATGPVDPGLPMELDDGRRVTPGTSKRAVHHPHLIAVDFAGTPFRDSNMYGHAVSGMATWFYHPDTGVFDGGDENTYFVLRNSKCGFTASVTACRKRKLVL